MSVLGPTLWNILYDEVLGFELTEEITCLTFADDLSVLIGADDPLPLVYRVNELLERIAWMDYNNLELAGRVSRERNETLR